MRIAITALFLPLLAFAQSGHWSGAIQAPGEELKVEIDLLKNEAGVWAGAISIPAQNMKDFPLSSIAIQQDAVQFTMKGIPGDPEFRGKLASDRQSIAGDFSQNGGTIPFKLTRTGDAKFTAVPKSTPIGKDLEGNWEGTLEAGGNNLRLVLKLSNGADGAAGSLVSLDQGGVDIPITTITQEKSHLKLDVKAVSGSYEGDLAGDKITGTWTQNGSAPLTFKRAK